MVKSLSKVSENGRKARKMSVLGNGGGANYLKLSNPKWEAFPKFV